MQKLPLDGLRVIDFTLALAGPHLTQWLAVMGAEVIKIESTVRAEASRLPSAQQTGKAVPPIIESVTNCSKKSITLNMKQPKAVELVRELVKISDIVAENFGGPILERWGVGYQELKKIKPGIIFWSGSGYGRTGPLREFPALAPILDAFDGLSTVNGYAGGQPSQIGSAALTDVSQGLYGVFAILAALHHRSETGEGEYIDAAMSEGCTNILGELVMDYTMNGRVGELVGNRNKIMAPHGCYRCQGEDKWVAIAISSEEEWKRFCKAIGNPDWTKKVEFSNEVSRWKNREELDKLVGQWTKNLDHYEVMEKLQKVGVMAGASLNLEEVEADPHLKARKFFIDIGDAERGELRLASLPWRLSDTPRGNYYAAPLLGEHNDYVFGELLGMPRNEVKRLEAEKVIY